MNSCVMAPIAVAICCDTSPMIIWMSSAGAVFMGDPVAHAPAGRITPTGDGVVHLALCAKAFALAGEMGAVLVGPCVGPCDGLVCFDSLAFRWRSMDSKYRLRCGHLL